MACRAPPARVAALSGWVLPPHSQAPHWPPPARPLTQRPTSAPGPSRCPCACPCTEGPGPPQSHPLPLAHSVHSCPHRSPTPDTQGPHRGAFWLLLEAAGSAPVPALQARRPPMGQLTRTSKALRGWASEGPQSSRGRSSDPARGPRSPTCLAKPMATPLGPVAPPANREGALPHREWKPHWTFTHELQSLLCAKHYMQLNCARSYSSMSF